MIKTSWFKKRNRNITTGIPFLVANNFSMPDLTVSPEWAMKNSDVYAVVNLISSAIAKCKFMGVEPITDVLNSPNRLVNAFSFWQAVVKDMLLYGNAYVLINRDTQGQLLNLEKVEVENVMVNLSDNGQSLTYQISFSDDRPTKVVSSDDILHFKLMTNEMANGQYTGRSPLESLEPELNIIHYANELSVATIKNNISSTLIAQAREGILNDKQKDRIRDQLQKLTGGENAGSVIVTDQAIDLTTLNTNNDNVSKLLKTLDWSRDQVAKAFGVPATVINGQGDQQSSIEMSHKTYTDDLETKYISPIESEVSLKFKADIKLDTSSITDSDGTTTINNIANLVKNGVLAPDDGKAILQRKGVI